MSRRKISDEEQALWSGFVRSITPLRPQPKSAKATAADAKPAAPAPAERKQRDVAPPVAAPRKAAPPLAPLGRRLKQRVARGREPIDDRIDLHGMTQTQAHSALARFLQRAQDDGQRTVLVVTGKGSRGRDATPERGVLKRQVPMWLELPEFRRFVVGFEAAHVGHGGEGALYVRLRRSR